MTDTTKDNTEHIPAPEPDFAARTGGVVTVDGVAYGFLEPDGLAENVVAKNADALTMKDVARWMAHCVRRIGDEVVVTDDDDATAAIDALTERLYALPSYDRAELAVGIRNKGLSPRVHVATACRYSGCNGTAEAEVVLDDLDKTPPNRTNPVAVEGVGDVEFFPEAGTIEDFLMGATDEDVLRRRVKLVAGRPAVNIDRWPSRLRRPIWEALQAFDGDPGTTLSAPCNKCKKANPIWLFSQADFFGLPRV